MDIKISRNIQVYIDKSKEEVIESLKIAIDELKEYDAIMIENSRANTAMAKDYNRVVNKCTKLEAEVENLKKALKKSIEDNKLKKDTIFGRSTEKFPDIINGTESSEILDEATEEELRDELFGGLIPKERQIQHTTKERRKGEKSRGKRKEDLANLPELNTYQLNVEELNKKYGENNWRIAFWHSHCVVECIPTTVYKSITYTPIVSVGIEHTMSSIPIEFVLIKNSIASASLVSMIMYHKYVLSLPIYRQEKFFNDLGLILSRQTMNNWVNRLAMEVFSLVYDKLKQLLMEVEYHQCDETFFRVNKDGRKAGSKSYMWVHMTSELIKEHPVIVYCFELTRGTDHLRNFYEDFKGFITCDAYISYHVLGKENINVIIICGCLMHLRRRYVQSLSLIDTNNLTQNEIDELPEAKALKLIGEIYAEDEPLKNLSSIEREKIRNEKVRPLINKFYEYIEDFNLEDPLLSDKLKEAIRYSKNQKEYIIKFLDDGNIPIDDGATERAIRNFTIGRKNWVACDSILGAETAAIMYSIVETARANKVNIYLYLRYILEEVPKYLEGTSLDFLDDMLPWSKKYLEYEKEQKLIVPHIELKENQYATKPKTPRKSGVSPPNKSMMENEIA